MKWTKWFAWYPVKVYGKWTFLKIIKRTKVCFYFSHPEWEYKPND